MAIRKFDPIGNPEDAEACDPRHNRLIPRSEADSGDQEEPEEQAPYDPALALVPGRPAAPDGIKVVRGAAGWYVWIEGDWHGLAELTPEQKAAAAIALARR